MVVIIINVIINTDIIPLNVQEKELLCTEYFPLFADTIQLYHLIFV